MDARDKLVQTRLTAQEAKAVEQLARSSGVKVGVLTRELLVRHAMGEVIDAWARNVEEWRAGRGQISEDGTVHFKLRPLEQIRPNDLVVQVFQHGRDPQGHDLYSGPCSSASLLHQDFVAHPDQVQLQLRGSRLLWRVVSTFDVSPVDGSKPYTKVFLQKGRKVLLLNDHNELLALRVLQKYEPLDDERPAWQHFIQTLERGRSEKTGAVVVGPGEGSAVFDGKRRQAQPGCVYVLDDEREQEILRRALISDGSTNMDPDAQGLLRTLER